MKNIIFFLFLSALIFSNAVLSQNPSPQINGYIQMRASSDFATTNDLMIRRAVLSLNGKPHDIENLTYKLQILYRSYKEEGVIFQDAYADLKLNDNSSIRAGRFTPEFMLFRTQPDYEIPVMERAQVTDALIHNVKTISRLIGIQSSYQFSDLPFRCTVGIFNANLEVPGKNKDRNLLYITHNQLFLLKNNDSFLETGFSFSYRYANEIVMNKIFDDTLRIRGNDYRFGGEVLFRYKDFSVQTEYVEARICNTKAWGMYGLFTYSLSKEYQIVAMIDKYDDLILTTNDSEWYGIGLNYYITERTKFLSDFKTQFSSKKNSYIGELQFQVFFN